MILAGDAVYGESPADVARSTNEVLRGVSGRISGELSRIGRHFDYEGTYNDGRLATKIEVEDDLPLDPRNTLWVYDDFLGAVTTTFSSLYGFTNQSSGAGGAGCSAVVGEALHPGIIEMDTGTGATGEAGIAQDVSTPPILLGSASCRFVSALKTPSAVSTASEGYRLLTGLMDSIVGLGSNGVHFSYIHSAFSGNWGCRTVSGGTGTTTDTGLVVKADTWATFEILINGDASEVVFFIDGDAVARHTTNIPTAAGQEVALVAGNIVKTAGNTARSAYVDYCGFRMDFTEDR